MHILISFLPPKIYFASIVVFILVKALTYNIISLIVVDFIARIFAVLQSLKAKGSANPESPFAFAR